LWRGREERREERGERRGMGVKEEYVFDLKKIT
jgi:hypothetical protein